MIAPSCQKRISSLLRRYAVISVIGLGLLAAIALLAVRAASPPRASAGTVSAFRLSPIEAALDPASKATRFSVSVSGAPTDLQPSYNWTIRPDAAGCANQRLFGAADGAAGAYVWHDQGATFVWYWSGGRPCTGTVSVVVENEYQHCTATFNASASTTPGHGPPAVCGLGGYTLPTGVLPVPAGLLRAYAGIGSELERLIRTAGRENARGLAVQVGALGREQQQALARFYPPVWGCPFVRLFEPLAAAAGSLAGAHLTPAAARTAADELRAAAAGVSSCGRTSSATRSAATALAARLVALANSIDTAARGVPSTTRLDAQLRGKAAALTRLLNLRLPPAFGTPYGELVQRVIAESAALASARSAAAAHRLSNAVAALARASKPAGELHRGAVKEQQRVVKIENANG